MRAWQIVDPVGPRGLALSDLADPVPGPHDVVVGTRAVALNHRDLLVIGGRYGDRVRAGTIPCTDAAGEVVAVGTDVARCRVGDRVTSTVAPAWIGGPFSGAAAASVVGVFTRPGVLAERFVLPETGVVPIPDHMTCEQASTLPCSALTAWHALFGETPLPSSGIVLTIGTGGVSLFAAQFALTAGARVIATSRDEGKLARLGELGVHYTINTVRIPDWGARAREMAGGDGVDQVIEVGGQGTLEQSLRAVRPGGTISLIGTLAHQAPVSLLPVLMRNIRLQGVTFGSREMFERMNATLTASRLDPVIDSVVPFEQAPDAFARLASGLHVGKVVIRTS
jgi:NADPH:quinone reductase-like Zn-dependent oxidoreductase